MVFPRQEIFVFEPGSELLHEYLKTILHIVETRGGIEMEKYSVCGKIFVMIRSLLVTYVVTALLLFLLAFLLFRLDLDESKVSLGMVAVYILSCLFGGFAAGKGGKNRKFLWGLLNGSLYFLILLAVSLGKGGADGLFSWFTTGALCLGSGMLGGMFS